MSELVDDVVGGCTRVEKAEPEDLRPPLRATYSSLLYLL
jgi:hypothetical protein